MQRSVFPLIFSIMFVASACGSASPTATPSPGVSLTPTSAPATASATLSPTPTLAPATASAAITPTPASPTAIASATPNPTPTPSEPATFTPAPTASPVTGLAALALQFSDIATAAIAQCNKDKAGVSGDLAKGKAAAQKCLDSYSQYVTAFKSIDWGPVQSQANNVIAAIDTIDGLLGQMANAPDGGTFMTAYNKLSKAIADLYTATNVLRVALGLPPTAP